MRGCFGSGVLCLGGAYLNPTDTGLLIFLATSAEEVVAIAEANPYVKAGLVLRKEVREYAVVVGSFL
jgi:uncharacterized protein YciI